jgi:hypothetical protein
MKMMTAADTSIITGTSTYMQNKQYLRGARGALYTRMRYQSITHRRNDFTE